AVVANPFPKPKGLFLSLFVHFGIWLLFHYPAPSFPWYINRLLNVQISANCRKRSSCPQPSHVSWPGVHEYPWQEYRASFPWLPRRRSLNTILISRDRSIYHTYQPPPCSNIRSEPNHQRPWIG